MSRSQARTVPEAEGAPRGPEPHSAPPAEVASEWETDLERGLERATVSERQARYGPNALPESEPPGPVAIVARQFRDALVLLLVGATAVAIALGELIDGAVIGAIVVLNAALGAVQEGRAEGAASAVLQLLSPTAVAVRDGEPGRIDAAELVPGDLVLLEAGDRVPADGRIVLADRFEVDESTMTGESVPAPKRSEPPDPPGAPLADRRTMAFSGTTVSRGSARLLVTATGTGTQLARIAAASERERPITPLQRRLNRLAGVLLRAAIAICVGLAAISWAHGESLGDSVLVGISLAVAAVPEGLAAVVTITLALGMRRLAGRGAIVRRLRAVETLGSASVICTDKTGTLTTNRMAVARLLPAGEGAGPGAEAQLLSAALIASGDFHDPGEAAIGAAGRERGLRREDLLEGRSIVGTEPFDSERKRMSVTLAEPSGERRAFVKGAPEVLGPRLADGGEGDGLVEAAASWAAEAVRVLMVAQRRDLAEDADPESELEPLGLIGIVDPLREGARPSVEAARGAGVRTVMVTGDHPGTAVAMARAAGIGPAGREPIVVTGSELDGMGQDELRERIGEIDVFARVVPEHKSRIVDALQARAQVVAMTGDGVNDAPALAAADIGVAMGRGGSDAAVEAAEIVLTDNDFSTLVAAIEGGRRIYSNIVAFVNFLLSANAGEVLLFAMAVIPGTGAPLTIVQILMVNLLTDGLPAVALGSDPSRPETMRRGPRPRSEGLLSPTRERLLTGAAATGLGAFAAYLIGLADDHATAQTMAFATVVFAQLGYVYAVRGAGSALSGGRNRFLHAGVLASAAIAACVLAVPGLREAFDTTSISAGQLAASLGLATLPFVATELVKALRRRGTRDSEKHGGDSERTTDELRREGA